MMKNLDKLLAFIGDLENMRPRPSSIAEEVPFVIDMILEGWINILEEAYLPDSPTEYILSRYDCIAAIEEICENVEDSLKFNMQIRSADVATELEKALRELATIRDRYVTDEQASPSPNTETAAVALLPARQDRISNNSKRSC